MRGSPDISPGGQPAQEGVHYPSSAIVQPYRIPPESPRNQNLPVLSNSDPRDPLQGKTLYDIVTHPKVNAGLVFTAGGDEAERSGLVKEIVAKVSRDGGPNGAVALFDLGTGTEQRESYSAVNPADADFRPQRVTQVSVSTRPESPLSHLSPHQLARAGVEPSDKEPEVTTGNQGLVKTLATLLTTRPPVHDERPLPFSVAKLADAVDALRGGVRGGPQGTLTSHEYVEISEHVPGLTHVSTDAGKQRVGDLAEVLKRIVGEDKGISRFTGVMRNDPLGPPSEASLTAYHLPPGSPLGGTLGRAIVPLIGELPTLTDVVVVGAEKIDDATLKELEAACGERTRLWLIHSEVTEAVAQRLAAMNRGIRAALTAPSDRVAALLEYGFGTVDGWRQNTVGSQSNTSTGETTQQGKTQMGYAKPAPDTVTLSGGWSGMSSEGKAASTDSVYGQYARIPAGNFPEIRPGEMVVGGPGIYHTITVPLLPDPAGTQHRMQTDAARNVVTREPQLPQPSAPQPVNDENRSLLLVQEASEKPIELPPAVESPLDPWQRRQGRRVETVRMQREGYSKAEIAYYLRLNNLLD